LKWFGAVLCRWASADFTIGTRAGVFLLIQVAAAADFDAHHSLRKFTTVTPTPCKPAGGLIGLPSGTCRRTLSTVITPCSWRKKPRSGWFFDGDAATVVFDRHGAIVVDHHADTRSAWPAIASSMELSTTS